MDKKEIFRKIGVIIGELNEQYQYLAANPENVNDLELELFGANSDFLEAQVVAEAEPKPEPPVKEAALSNPEAEVLRQPVTPVPQVEKDVAEEVKLQEQIQKRIDEIAARPAVPVPEISKPESREAALSEQVSVAAAPSVIEEQPVVREVIIPEKVTSIEVPVEPVSNASASVSQQATPAPTINDLISAQRSQSSAPSPLTSVQPVSDLKSAISLNDKLLFIKDLFNGYSLAYSEAIELVNRFNSFEEADNFLKSNYAAKNNWVSKQATVDKFYELLNRRFAK